MTRAATTSRVEASASSTAAANGAHGGARRSRLPRSTLSDLVVTVLLASALLLPAFIGNAAWPPALVFALGAAAVELVRRRRFPPVPAMMAAFLAVYAAAAIHGGELTDADAARYFLRPLAALAIAALATTAVYRTRALWLLVLFAAVQVPVTAVQAIENVVRYGSDSRRGADLVTGTLGASQAGTVTMVAAAIAIVAVSAWLVGLVRAKVALPVAGAFLTVGIFSSTRALIPFVVAATAALAAVGATVVRWRRASPRMLAALGAVAIASLPAIYFGIGALYPGAWNGAFGSQLSSVLVPAARQPSPGASAPERRNVRRGVQLLPGRFEQIRIATELSTSDGVPVALLGRGFGSALLQPGYTSPPQVPRPQRTGFTWVGKLLTETGWLGLAAFCALLLWLVVVGRDLWRRAEPAADQLLGATLVGVAALTSVCALFTTVLDVRGYSAVFWILVGLGIAAGRALPTARERDVPARPTV